MITAHWVSASGLHPLASPDEVPDSEGFLWLDSDAQDDAADSAVLTRRFAPPAEAMEEILAQRHPPKFELIDDDALFLMLRGLDEHTRDLSFGTIQIALLAGPGVLFTRHTGVSPSICAVMARLAQEPITENSPMRTALTIAETVFGRFLPIVLAIEQRLEALEDVLFENADDRVLSELTGYRTSLKRMRRITAYHQGAISEMAGSALLRKARSDRRLVRECADNLERAASLQALFHDLCGDLIDSYLALAAHRLNDIMKLLTIVTAIFVPLGFLAGIYGMNFELMPELRWKWGYFTLIGVMATIAASLLLLFRRQRWI